MSDLDPTAVMAAHIPFAVVGEDYRCRVCVEDAGYEAHPAPWPCLPYRLADALAAEMHAHQGTQDKVNRAWSQERFRKKCRAKSKNESFDCRLPLGHEGDHRNGQIGFRQQLDEILASLPEDDPGEDPWGGANLERP